MIGYNKSVSVVAEERAFEAELESRKSALAQRHRYISPLIGRVAHSGMQATQIEKWRSESTANYADRSAWRRRKSPAEERVNIH